MKIVAYKCEDTDAIFEHEKDYRAQRAKYLREKRAKEKHIAAGNKFKDWLAEEKLKITNVSMIGPWVLENQRKLMEAGNFFKLSSFGAKFKLDSDVLAKYEITNIFYNDKISNTHSCPYNGVTNWGSKNDKPNGYPGWRGRISGSLNEIKKIWEVIHMIRSVNSLA